MTQANSIAYVANAGVLLKIGGKKILIDGLCNPKLQLFKPTPMKIRERIIWGASSFGQIVLMLITHDQDDHFDADRVGRFLVRTPPNCCYCQPRSNFNDRKPCFDAKFTGLIELAFQSRCEENFKVNGIDIQAITMIL